MVGAAEARSFRMDGTLVLVTGAVRGIGAAVVRRLVGAGAMVGFTYRPSGANERYAGELVASIGASDRVMALVADASDRDETEAVVAQLTERFDRHVDVAIANAGDTSKVPWTEITVDQWDAMMAINLRGAFVLARAVGDGMRNNGYGKIITVGSVMANIGDPRSLHYVTTKAGIIGFTRSLARAEGKHGIRVNCLVPGAIHVEKELDQGSNPAKTLEWLKPLQCLQYRGAPEDTAAGIHYLASHASDFMTGQVLNIDGGWAHY